MKDIKYKTIVGLEIHVHVGTRTKMFCGCELVYGENANSRVCPVCLGLPGSLPVMNKQALEFAIMAGLALECEIAKFTKWDRKNYYYPDLPKNYQISQYDLPFSSNGFIEIPLESGETKKIRIIRAHLEEDAGKNIHGVAGCSQVDLNRAGTPLLEIVTEPDMNSPEEVRALAIELQKIVRYLGVSEGDMQKGHMRFEPNINLVIEKEGKTYKTPITEVKNLNSFKALERSVAYEVERQLDEFLETGKTKEMGNKTTRGWDDVHQVTVLQREKEEAHDYRYFPDPDLLPVTIDEKWLNEIRSKMCELPLSRQKRYMHVYGLGSYDAGVLTADRSTAEFYDAVVTGGADPKRACNLIAQTGLKIANEKGLPISELDIEPSAVTELSKMIEQGTVNASAGNEILAKMIETHQPPQELAESMNLIQKSDAGELESFVDEAIAANPQAFADVKEGGKKSKKALGFLMGQIMQKSKGRANPQVVSQILERKFI